jgi:hypothetical protein
LPDLVRPLQNCSNWSEVGIAEVRISEGRLYILTNLCKPSVVAMDKDAETLLKDCFDQETASTDSWAQDMRQCNEEKG